MNRKITVFIPIRNEEDSIPSISAELIIFESFLRSINLDLEILVHDNNSSDSSWKVIKNWALTTPQVRAYKFARNLGYQESLSLAFNHAEGDAFIILQADLQDPPLIMKTMVERWLSGDKCVVGVASSREESFMDKFGRNIFIQLYKRSGDFEDFIWFTDFYLLDKSKYLQLRNLPLSNQFIRGKILQDIGVDSTIEYKRAKRIKGKTNFSFVKKYNFAIDALLLISGKFIRRITLCNILLFLFNLGFICFVTLMNITDNEKFRMLNYTLDIAGIVFILSYIGIITGVILEYLSRIYRKLHSTDFSSKNASDIYYEVINV